MAINSFSQFIYRKSVLTNVVQLHIHLVNGFWGNLSKTGFVSKRQTHNVLLSPMQYKIVKVTNTCNVKTVFTYCLFYSVHWTAVLQPIIIMAKTRNSRPIL